MELVKALDLVVGMASEEAADREDEKAIAVVEEYAAHLASKAAIGEEQPLKLYEAPQRTWVRILMKDPLVPPCAPELAKEQVVFFDHLDGMYSFCKDTSGRIVHLRGGAEVAIATEQEIQLDYLLACVAGLKYVLEIAYTLGTPGIPEDERG